jgi:parvulin-like peptidyl-prolyl isomerase
MAQGVFAIEPSDTTWHGPFESEYGAHLVMLTRNIAGRYPGLAEVESGVRDDAEREAIAALKNKAIQAIVDTYEVRRSFERPAIGLAQ